MTLAPSRQLFIDLKGARLSADERALLSERRFGGVCLFGYNIDDRFQLADYVAEVRSLAGEEFLIAIDQEGGGVLRLADVPYPPSAMALGAAGDPELTEAVAAATGHALASVGVNLNFAPVADVNVNPHNPVIADRSFGADPRAVGEHVAAFVRGLQSAGVAATIKHFPGHGDTNLDSHLSLPTLRRTQRELVQLELPPFEAGISAGAAAVMSAHIVFEALDASAPATLSPTVLRALLRERLGFEGVVFSDALDMLAITERHSPGEANVLALEAGVDAPVNIGSVHHHVGVANRVDEALAAGELDPAAVMASLARLEALARAFPARKGAPANAWRPGDRELIESAAARGLVALGEVPLMTAGEEVTVLTAFGVWRNAAEQERVTPGPDLIRELTAAGVRVRSAIYDPERLGEEVYENELLGGLGEGLVVLASSRRTPLAEPEVNFARRVANAHAGRYLHVALWNPYHAHALPGPALLSFGFRPASLRAVVAALKGAPVTGRLPVEFAACE